LFKVLERGLLMSLKNSINVQNDLKATNLANFNAYKSLKCFSRIKAKGFELLSSGISKFLIKQDLSILSSKLGVLALDDPMFYLILDLIGQNKNIVVYSSDNSEDEIIAKLILKLANLNEFVLKKGALINSVEVQNTFSKASNIVYNSNLHILKGSILNSLWNELINFKKINKLDVLIIDYLEALSLNDSKSMQELLEYFNQLSKHIETPIVLFSRK